MKTARVLKWVLLVGVGTLGACGGVSAIGSGDEDPNKGGSATMGTDPGKDPSGMGAVGMGAATGVGGGMAVAGKPGMPGTDPGTGMPLLCKEDAECQGEGPLCQMCADGTVACPKAICAEGKCIQTGDSCKQECTTDKECPPPDPGIVCTDCGDGTQACPISQCLNGKCEPYLLGCNEINPCNGLACGTECKVCGPDGMCDANVASYCSAEGKCQPGLPQCAQPGECKTSMDCGEAPPKCVPCSNNTCAGFDCIQGKCAFTCPANPEPQCKVTEDCPVMDDVCKLCPSGKCAIQACIQATCELVCPL